MLLAPLTLLQFYHALCHMELNDIGGMRSLSPRIRTRFLNSRILSWRGGSTLPDKLEINNESTDQFQPQERDLESSKLVDVVVSTIKISGFVDQRCQLQLASSSSIIQLKEEISKKFPGKPPVFMQRIFASLSLLNDESLLQDIEKDKYGRVQLILDMPPPIDIENFDPNASIPSTRESQVEAYCANMVSLTQLLQGSNRAQVGRISPFSDPNAPFEMNCSFEMQKHMQNLSDFLHFTKKDVGLSEGVRDGEIALPSIPPHGPLHEPFRRIAFYCDVDWRNTIMMTVFIGLCAKFGSFSSTLSVYRVLATVALFAAQLRPMKFAFKYGYNAIRQYSLITNLIIALLPAPDQVLLKFDEKAYVQKLYGVSGPSYSPEYEKFLEEISLNEDGLI